MSRYVPGYTGPTTTAGPLKPKNPIKPVGPRPIKPVGPRPKGTMGDGVGGRPKGTGKPAAGMAGARLGKMMGMANGGVVNPRTSLKPTKVMDDSGMAIGTKGSIGSTLGPVKPKNPIKPQNVMDDSGMALSGVDKATAVKTGIGLVGGTVKRNMAKGGATKKGMPIGLPTPKRPVRVEKVDVRGVDGKPIKGQKPVLFGMAKGGAAKKGMAKGGAVKKGKK